MPQNRNVRICSRRFSELHFENVHTWTAGYYWNFWERYFFRRLSGVPGSWGITCPSGPPDNRRCERTSFESILMARYTWVQNFRLQLQESAWTCATFAIKWAWIVQTPYYLTSVLKRLFRIRLTSKRPYCISLQVTSRRFARMFLGLPRDAYIPKSRHSLRAS